MDESLALQLQQSPVWAVISRTNRTEWLAHCAALPSEDIAKPKDNEIFTCCDGLQSSDARTAALRRLNRYGIISGQYFVTKHSDLKGKRFTFACAFYGESTRNNWDLESEVEVDQNGQVISKRQRNTAHQRSSCPVQYYVAYYQRSEQWIGRWKVPESEHSQYHRFPFDPTYWLEFKRQILQYQGLQILGQKLRYSKIPYRQARKIFSDEGVGMLMTQKEYYNLADRAVKDIGLDDTPGALLAVFDQANWKYLLRVRHTNDHRKIIQIFFWCDRTRASARRYVSNALLIVDATFRTNRKGLPLIVGVGKSSTSRTFPVAFSWVPEEDAASYEFFYQCLREQVFDGVPEPATVLTDLSGGMTRAYDILECLPNSELQYCQWHAYEAMVRWFRGHSYTSDEVDVLKALASTYLRSYTEQDLTQNRSELVSTLLPEDRKYITDHWQDKESRLIECYVRQFTNFGHRTTQMSESYNVVIHSVTDHKMSMKSAAQGLIDYVDDFYRDFESDLVRAQGKTLTAIPSTGFSILRRTITLQALESLLPQWKILSRSNGNLTQPCTGSFRKQNLLPCAHDLRRAFQTGECIPRCLIHPRWWLDDVESVPSSWRPQYGDEDTVPQTVRPTTELNGIQAAYEDIVDSVKQLEGSDQLHANTAFLNILSKAKELMDRRIVESKIPLGMPDEVPRFAKRIPTANEALDIATKQAQMQAKAAAKEAAQQAKDKAILAARQVTPQVTQSTQDTIVVAVRTLPSSPIPSPTSSSLPVEPPSISEDPGQVDLDEENNLQPDFEPPASTAPPRIEDTGLRKSKRARANTRYEDAIMQLKRQRDGRR